MKSKKSIVLVLMAACLAASGQAGDSDGLAWPGADSWTRPWAYWWWMGSAVAREDLTQNLEACRAAGYGGLHIVPIYGAKGYEDQYIEFLGDGWMKMLDHAVKEAGRLQMGIDMTTGTGWCFGGPDILESDACSDLVVARHRLEADRRLSRTFDAAKVRAVAACSGRGDVLELTGRIAPDGRLDWTAPEGAWQLYSISRKPTGRRVKRAAPGGEGYMLDPFSAGAMERYLKRFEEAFAGYGGPKPRAMYHDSYEYMGNGSDELLAEFEKRRGYRLQNELPSLLGEGARERVARVRTDYNETLSDMHLAYIRTWAAWSHEHGFETRNQAHGSPSNLLDAYAAAGIPETEMFRTDRDILFSKFASSAAHVAGRRRTAAETGTWLGEHFTVTLGRMKALADRLFLSGVNHILYHGTCYSPGEAPWPGWVFYASTQMNPRNAIWRDAPALNAYIARCQSILQAGRPDGDVLLYWPIHDFWHHRPEVNVRFSVHAKWYEGTAFREVAEGLLSGGWSFDYISDLQLQDARVDGPSIVVPGGAYRAVVVPRCTVIPLKTMRKLNELACGGAPVIFQDRLPWDVPGLHDLDTRRRELRVLTDRGERFMVGESIEKMLSAAGIARETIVDHPGVMFVRSRHDAGLHYFIANTGGAPLDGFAALATGAVSVALMDPLTGACGMAACRKDSKGRLQVRVQLPPGGSCIVRTFSNREIDGPPWPYHEPAGPPHEIAGTWKVAFLEGGPVPPAAFETDRLASWTELGGEEAERFAGTARYTVLFDAPEGGTGTWLLDLGRVEQSARVRLNGEGLGTLFCPPFRVPVASLERIGNTLEVEVTSLSANRIRDLDRRTVPWKIFHDINFVDIDYKPFDASGWPLRESGLIGPVRLIPVRRE